MFSEHVVTKTVSGKLGTCTTAKTRIGNEARKGPAGRTGRSGQVRKERLWLRYSDFQQNLYGFRKSENALLSQEEKQFIVDVRVFESNCVSNDNMLLLIVFCTNFFMDLLLDF